MKGLRGKTEYDKAEAYAQVADSYQGTAPIIKRTIAAEAVLDILIEYEEARKKFPGLNSAHEGCAVILKELDDLWLAVKNDNHNPEWKKEAKKEARQVAAMALAFILEV